MVGTKKSGNPTPSNSVRLCLTAELQDFLASLPNEKGIPTEYMILQGFLQHYKTELLGKLGEENYAELCERYNRNRAEMAEDKKHRVAEASKRRMERLKLKKNELEVRIMEAKNRKKELSLQEERLTITKQEAIEEAEGDVRFYTNKIRELEMDSRFFKPEDLKKEKKSFIALKRKAEEKLRELKS